MSKRDNTANDLADAIKLHASGPLTDAEAAEGARNLTNFFLLLREIDQRNHDMGHA